MSIPVTIREVKLVANQSADRSLVRATVRRGCRAEELAVVELSWGRARAEAAGRAELEHDHWDWRNKTDSVSTGSHVLAAVECSGEYQGLMATFADARPSRLGGGQVVYVDYLEVAPWNLRAPDRTPRYGGVGSVLLVEAIHLSRDGGHDGRVGLHSLPQAEAFYARCGMTLVGRDFAYYGFAYFEYTVQQATAKLTVPEEHS